MPEPKGVMIAIFRMGGESLDWMAVDQSETTAQNVVVWAADLAMDNDPTGEDHHDAEVIFRWSTDHALHRARDSYNIIPDHGSEDDFHANDPLDNAYLAVEAQVNDRLPTVLEERVAAAAAEHAHTAAAADAALEASDAAWAASHDAETARREAEEERLRDIL